MIADEFRAMGTFVSVTAPTQAGIDATQRWFETVEQVCSRFRADSDLTSVNDALAQRVRLSPLLCEVLAAADKLRLLTGGLVDPAVGGDVIRWGYDRTYEEVEDCAAPSEARCTNRSWSIRDGWLVRGVDLRLDLGGVAKGWAADRAVETGLASIVSAGGDVRSANPDAIIRILDPDEEVVGTVPLGRGALATSSVARRRWRTGGQTANHIIDPRNGSPAVGPIVSATVVARTAVEAEAGAKAMLLHGTDGLAWVAAQPWLDGGLAVWADGSVFATANLEVAV